jgi:hypothetical protein
MKLVIQTHGSKFDNGTEFRGLYPIYFAFGATLFRDLVVIL